MATRQQKQVKPSPKGAVQTTQTVSQSWSGPLPPPAALEKFNDIIPGGAARILEMAEREQAHRIKFEQHALDAEVKADSRGQYLGTTIAALAIIGAIVNVALSGHWQVSCALVGVPVLGVVSAIIQGRSSKPKK